jgi:hypothetical protein
MAYTLLKILLTRYIYTHLYSHVLAVCWSYLIMLYLYVGRLVYRDISQDYRCSGSMHAVNSQQCLLVMLPSLEAGR